MMDFKELKNKNKSELISIIEQLTSENLSLEDENRLSKAKASALSSLSTVSSVEGYFHSLLSDLPLKPTGSLRLVLEGKDLFNQPVVDGVGFNHEDFQYLDDQIKDQLGGKSVLEIEDTSRVHNLLFKPEMNYPRSIYAFPIIFSEKKVGFMWAADQQINAYSDQDVSQMRRIVGEFEWALGFLVEHLKKKQAESVCAAVFNSLDNPVLLCDASGEIFFHNQSAESEFGLDQADRKRGDGITDFLEALRQLPKIVNIQIDNLEFEGSKFTVNVPHFGNSYLYRFKNNTQEKKRERYLAAIIDAITADISRRLEAIKGFTSLVASLGELSPKQTEYINEIAGESNRIKKKTTGLLDINRMKADGFLNLNSVNITDLICDIVPQFQPVITHKQLKLRLDLGKDIIHIETDAEVFEQLILNLLESATQDAKIGSEVAVVLKENGNNFSLSIEDKSTGLSRPDIEAILLDQVGVADIHKNLYNARIITELLLGKIGIESQLGEGKKVNILLEQNT